MYKVDGRKDGGLGIVVRTINDEVREMRLAAMALRHHEGCWPAQAERKNRGHRSCATKHVLSGTLNYAHDVKLQTKRSHNLFHS